MLLNALNIIKDALNTYLVQRLGSADVAEVILANVAQAEFGEAELEGKLIVSIVNLEEERALKNARTVRPNLGGGFDYENAPVSLNLYLLFSANFAIAKYDIAIRVLSTVLTFFQRKQSFTVANDPNSLSPDLSAHDLKITFNLYTMTFEQLNHLWGALGGKQIPSVLYRVHLVQLEDEQVRGGGQLIEEVVGNTQSL